LELLSFRTVGKPGQEAVGVVGGEEGGLSLGVVERQTP
jgi:hypothetical protein